MGIAIRLVVRRAGDDGLAAEEPAVFVLGGRDAVVGRDPRGEVIIADPTVSSRHCLLRATAAGYEASDLGSSNGTALLARGAAAPEPLLPGRSVPVGPGDTLLLGSASAPVRVGIEEAASPFEPASAPARTVIARAPLSDLGRADEELVTLAAASIAAESPDALAEEGVAYLRRLAPDADGYALTVRGAGFVASAGAVPPAALEKLARERKEALLFQEEGEALPDSESIAREGVRAALVVPLVAHGTWHGFMACWSSVGAAALPASAVPSLAVASPLMALAASAVALRHEGEQARLRLEDENRRLRAGRSGPTDYIEPIGVSKPFQEAVSLCRTVAGAAVPVLVLGETGTGKEVLARAIHQWSPRLDRPFVAFNCAAVPEALVESELFGHKRGAFTGANTDRRGLFEQADGGTIFLDEIGEMPAPMQAKLLRVLQDGEVRRVGSNDTIRVDVRVISATHRDLDRLVAEGRFREDLTYRLNAISIRLPPLRERGEDIEILAHHLLGRACRRTGKRVPGFTTAALAALRSYGFPGNVRELDNEVLRGVALTPEGAPIDADVLSGAVLGAEGRAARPPGPVAPVGVVTLKEAVEAAERATVEAAIARTEGNISQAARDLGLTRPGLYKVLDRLGLR